MKRGVPRALTESAAEVRRTAPEGQAAELTLKECEVRKPVTGGARTGEADMDGMSGAMPPEAASREGVGTLRGFREARG